MELIKSLKYRKGKETRVKRKMSPGGQKVKESKALQSNAY